MLERQMRHADITWLPLVRKMAAAQLPPEWKSLDLLLVPYAGFGYL